MGPGFRCGCCGEWHDELPLDYGFAEPYYVAELDDDELARLVLGDGDFRTLRRDRETHHFIRGVIEIPIVGTDELFRYGVWTTLSAQNFEAARSAYRDDRDAGPFFGWLANQLPNYSSTLSLKTQVHVRADVRPAIELEPTDHPLAIEQRDGFTMERVQQLMSMIMHPSS